MRQQYRASVVIPSFNTKLFISDSIRSCLKQDQRLEIIVIDDGSTDDSYSYLKNNFSHYKNIKILNHNNLGLGETRNRGIKISSSPIILFLDSDDCFVEFSLTNVINNILKYELDMIGFSGTVNENSVVKSNPNYLKKQNDKIISGFELLKNVDLNQFSFSSVLWAYSKSFLEENNIKFHSKLHEDEGFTFECIFKAKKIITTSEVLYNRRIRENSITTSLLTIYNSEGWYESINQIQKLKQFAKNKKIKQIIDQRSIILLSNVLKVDISTKKRIEFLRGFIKKIGFLKFVLNLIQIKIQKIHLLK